MHGSPRTLLSLFLPSLSYLPAAFHRPMLPCDRIEVRTDWSHSTLPTIGLMCVDLVHVVRIFCVRSTRRFEAGVR